MPEGACGPPGRLWGALGECWDRVGADGVLVARWCCPGRDLGAVCGVAENSPDARDPCHSPATMHGARPKWGIVSLGPEGLVKPSGAHGLWRSLVAHLTGGQGVAGSNPVSPTEARGSESLRFRASRRNWKWSRCAVKPTRRRGKVIAPQGRHGPAAREPARPVSLPTTGPRRTLLADLCRVGRQGMMSGSLVATTASPVTSSVLTSGPVKFSPCSPMIALTFSGWLRAIGMVTRTA